MRVLEKKIILQLLFPLILVFGVGCSTPSAPIYSTCPGVSPEKEIVASVPASKQRKPSPKVAPSTPSNRASSPNPYEKIRTVRAERDIPRPAPQQTPAPVAAIEEVLRKREDWTVTAKTTNQWQIKKRQAVSPPASPSLFEEAILLGQLRGELQKIPGITPKQAEATRLQRSTVFLTVPRSLAPNELLRAVEISSNTRGVSTVQLAVE